MSKSKAENMRSAESWLRSTLDYVQGAQAHASMALGDFNASRTLGLQQPLSESITAVRVDVERMIRTLDRMTHTVDVLRRETRACERECDRTRSDKGTVAKLAHHLHCTIDDDDERVILDAPHRHRLVSTGGHSALTMRGDEPSTYFWGAVLDDLRPGVEPCPGPEDSECIARDCFGDDTEE